MDGWPFLYKKEHNKWDSVLILVVNTTLLLEILNPDMLPDSYAVLGKWLNFCESPFSHQQNEDINAYFMALELPDEIQDSQQSQIHRKYFFLYVPSGVHL